MAFENIFDGNKSLNDDEIRKKLTSTDDIIRKNDDHVIHPLGFKWIQPEGVYSSNEHTNKKD
mgnify:CR=1 FL=1|tara:strand:+ start:127 stop:312 length:186 start_codon:yes stop_codon:yes gene_type:complete